MLKHPLSAVNLRKARQAKHILKYILIQMAKLDFMTYCNCSHALREAPRKLLEQPNINQVQKGYIHMYIYIYMPYKNASCPCHI